MRTNHSLLLWTIDEILLMIEEAESKILYI
jgi:hypothetical protein